MRENIDTILQESKTFKIESTDDLENFRLKFLVKKGLVNQIFQEFKSLDSEEKKKWGKELNIFKNTIELLFKNAQVKLNQTSSNLDKNNENELLPGY